MIPKLLLSILVYALPVLVVAFGVVMGGYALSEGVSDRESAIGLWWTARGLLMLLAGDVILLIGALGIKALEEAEAANDGEQDRE